METLSTLGMLLGGSWASGINLYLTVLALGIADKIGFLSLPSSLDPVTHPGIMILAGALFAVEFIADKIPYVDSMWDSFHTFIRPLGGAIMGFMAMGEADPALQFGAALLTGAVAMDAHLTKATARAALNTSPEPISNMVASVAEDVSVIAMFLLVIKHPIVAAVLVALFIIASIWFLRRMWGFFRKVLRFGVRRADVAPTN